ncbi:hypothetical protein [Actinobacillus capsulatus]|uniref:hypothetical protein n=1 Tax=Actinobacillus capsulatus TaxID=717 RepID=UPI0003698C00|nr:hypothetical protein [Actinobacillus capsulatus]
MNIATKLMTTLVASLVITACSGGSSGSSAQPNTEPTPKTNIPAPKAEQPKKEEAPQADSPKVEEPKSIAPLMGSPKVEKQKENNLQEKSPKVDEPQVMDPKLGSPQKDAQKLEEPKNKSNAEILKELGIKDISEGELSVADTLLDIRLDDHEKVSIVILNNEINRKDLKVTNSIPNQDIMTLKDSSGKLLGYYGYMQLSQVREDANTSKNEINLNEHYLLSMNDAEKIRPAKSIEYTGNMFYGYKDSNEKLVANVQAAYNDSTKMLSMEVFGNSDHYWKLGETGRTKLPINRVQGATVDSDGTILNANLYTKIDSDSTKLTPDANFSGSIFGKNGEVLAGSAVSEKWRGVIGATATEKKQ